MPDFTDLKTGEVIRTVTITQKEYAQLIHDSHWLGCLEGAGVDNWGGYDYAHEAREGEFPCPCDSCADAREDAERDA